MEDDKKKLDPEYQDIENSGSRYRILNIFTRFLNHETMTMDWATDHYEANKRPSKRILSSSEESWRNKCQIDNWFWIKAILNITLLEKV